MTPRRPPDARLLRVLRSAAPESFLAADELARQAALSGEEVADRLSALRAAGYHIFGDPTTGWKMVAVPERLIADDLLAALPEDSLVGREIVVFEETDSTNDLAARAGEDGVPEGLVIFAESQRAGRGRLGRRWSSLPHQGLWFSVLLRPGLAPDRWPELTFCAALAVAETAETLTAQTARIKWPNDVIVAGRKIAGILLECHHRREPGFVVAGIGINVRQGETDFPPELRERAGSLGMAAGQAVERRAAAAGVMQRLDRLYAEWRKNSSRIIADCAKRGCTPS